LPKSTFYFSDGPYLQALQSLHQALTSPEALIKLIGNARTGKSTLCEKLMLFMQHKDYQVVYFNYAIESPEMLRTMLARQLRLPNATNFSRMLEDVPSSEDGKPLILIFDDAHLLTDTTLLEIYRLIGIQTGSTRRLNVLLCGEPLLEQKLVRRQELKSLLQQISHTISLLPMNNNELSQFLVTFLDKAGMPGLMLQPAAMSYYCKTSHGLPGPALMLAQLMLAARRDTAELKDISKAELLQLVQQSQASGSAQKLPGAQTRETNRWVVLAPLVAVVVVASIALLYQQLTNAVENTVEQADTMSAENEAESATVAPETVSPFAAEPVAATPATTPISVPAVSTANLATTAIVFEAEPEEPVSDSNLVLVTAAERGIVAADIADPVFEDIAVLATASAPVVTDSMALPVERAGSIQSPAAVVRSAAAPVPVVAETPAALATNSTASPPAKIPVVDVTPETAAAKVASNENAIETAAAPLVAAEEEIIAIAEVAEAAQVAEVVEVPEVTEVPEVVEVAEVAEIIEMPETVEVAEVAAATEVAAVLEVAEVPETQEPESDLAAVSARVQTWMSAWQSQNLDAYFASYHDDYEPRYHPSRQRWHQDRERVIGNAGSITLKMSDYAVISSSSERIEVQFWLDYASPTYADSTLKKLVFGVQQTEGKPQWLILEEVNLQVRS